MTDTAADLISALMMNNVPEAIGVSRAAQKAGIPVAVSFMVKTDGKLPIGDELGAAVAAVDAATGNGPAYFMINCAYPTHFAAAMAGNPRIRGFGLMRHRAVMKSSTMPRCLMTETRSNWGAFRRSDARAPATNRGRRMLRYRSPAYRADQPGDQSGGLTQAGRA